MYIGYPKLSTVYTPLGQEAASGDLSLSSRIITLTGGRIVLAQTGDYYGDNFAPRLLCLESSGSIVTGAFLPYGAFFSRGLATNNPVPGFVNTVTTQSDGKILAAGFFVSAVTKSAGFTNVTNSIIRFNTDGTVDTSFSPPIDPTTGGPLPRFTCLAQQADGKILAGGYWTAGQLVGSGSTVYLARFTPSGNVDLASFIQGTGFNGIVKDIIVQPDNKILVIGGFTTYSGSTVNRIVRLNPSGTIDPDFITGTGLGSTPSIVCKAVLQADGKIVLTATIASTYSGSGITGALLRILPSGARDLDFPSFVTGSNSGQYGGVALQEDQKILFFSQGLTGYSGSLITGGLIRILPSGGLDRDFSLNSTTATGAYFNFGIKPTGSINLGYTTNNISSVHVQPDGKIVVLGQFSHFSGVLSPGIVRLLPSGNIDSSFQNAGLTSKALVNCFGFQKSGKIVIGGNFKAVNGNWNYHNIARLNTDFSLDTSFGPRTASFFNGTLDPAPQSIIIQPDDKILVDGLAESYNGSYSGSHPTRLTKNGEFDIDWGRGYWIGRNATPGVSAMLLQPDGKIVMAGGNVQIPKGASATARPGLIRILPSGSQIDPDFANGINTTGSFMSIKYQSDGKLLCVGALIKYSGSTIPTGIVRILPSGGIDPDFIIGTGFSSSRFNLSVGGCPTGVSIESGSGKIVVVGDFTSYNGTSSNGIIKLTSSGSVDPDFFISGGFTISNTGIWPKEVVIDPVDNNIIVAGYASGYSGSTIASIVRISPSGSINRSFYTNFSTQSYIPFYNRNSNIEKNLRILYLSSSRDIYVSTPLQWSISNTNTASFPGDIFIMSTSGSLIDPERVLNKIYPKIGGRVVTPQYLGTGGSSMLTLPDQTTLIGHNAEFYGADYASKLLRINPSGSLNTNSFVPAYEFYSRYGTSPSQNSIQAAVNCIVTQSDGKILVGGLFDAVRSGGNLITHNGILRFNTDGTLEQNFGTESIITRGSNTNYVSCIALQSDGRIVIGGNLTSTPTYIRRLTASGALDSTFIAGGNFNAKVDSILVQSDNKLVVTGNFTSYSGATANRIVRLLPSGSIDPDFAVGTGFSTGSFSNTGVASILQPDSKIVVTGNFTAYSGSAITGIIRILSSGSIDPDFNVGGGTNQGDISLIRRNLLYQSDGKILIMGAQYSFYSGSSISSSSILRINPSGTLDNDFNYGSGSLIVSGFNTQQRGVWAAYEQPDKKLLLYGSFDAWSGSISDSASIATCLVRILPSGSIDPDFERKGLTSMQANLASVTDANGVIRAIGVQSDGKKIIGGAFYSINDGRVSTLLYRNIARLNSDLTLDTSFAGGSAVFSSPVRDIKIQSDDKIIVAGDFEFYNGNASASRITRLTRDGLLDTDFFKGHYFQSGKYYSIAIQSDGKILAAGFGNTRVIKGSVAGLDSKNIVRYLVSGGLDLSFKTASSNSSITSVTLQNDGKILVGGYFTSYSGSAIGTTLVSGAVRLRPTGDVDTDFNIGAGFSGSSVAGSEIVNGISLEPVTNKIVVIGQFSNVSGTTAHSVARLLSSGAVDPDFSPSSSFFGVNPLSLQNVAVLKDASILITGYFNTFRGTSSIGLVKIQPSGTVDLSFARSIGISPFKYVLSTGLQNFNSLFYNRFNNNESIIIGSPNVLITSGVVSSSVLGPATHATSMNDFGGPLIIINTSGALVPPPTGLPPDVEFKGRYKLVKYKRILY